MECVKVLEVRVKCGLGTYYYFVCIHRDRLMSVRDMFDDGYEIADDCFIVYTD